MALGGGRVTIRSATIADIPRLVEMGMRFLRTGSYQRHLAENPEQIAATARQMVESPDAAVFVAETDRRIVGMLAVFCYQHPLSGERVASELVWWVDPESRGAGLRLLRVAEQWAAAHGARALQMIAPDEHVGRLYEHRGYCRMETLYQRTVL